MTSAFVRHSYDHLREEEEDSSESSLAELVIPGAVSEAITSVSVMPNISTNKHTSDANPATTGVTSKPHNLESTNDGAEMNPHRSVCLEVFRNTWDEFYEWERGYCEARLVALMSERRKGTATLTSTAKTARPTSPPGPIWVIPCPTTTIDLSGVLADFDAGPQYESCTPLNGNVYVGDDPDVMPFLPFGEEDWDGYPLPDGGRKRFAYEGYIGEYSELAWMSAFDDPDLDCILYATTNRLASMSISYAQMDATGMFARTPRLPLLSAPSGDPPGLEARAAKRDFPPFPSLPSPGSSRPSPPAVLSTLRTRIYPLFCHNITCIRQICPTHSEGTPYPHATIPEKKSVYLVDNDSSPCSPTCFLLIAKPSGTALASSTFPNAVLPHAEHGQRGATGALRPAILDSWSAADRDTLITLLELDADARPCDLAVIMKKSCNDAVEVRRSAHGYGLFLKESVLADEFLMEYTGEAILDPTCISRDHIIAHRQRNYLFALHTTLGVDSSLAGDPSRFINHGNPPNLVDGSMSVGEGIANVYSHVEITNGGHGVVLYAAIDMNAGTELLLDYGPKFFKQISGGDEDGDEEDNVNEENVEREEAKKYTYWDDDPEYGEAEEYKE
ncbi:hypothetical protein CCMSSC00406_0005267 [Pleurotus cornucopiae]|uniref:Uncharacterized protein n=1 Tax=Pleurotus cornucopiae TaxID=5321 RepID=A0ACB7II20_PLECO|nr:hypothetical protein CCMSSC00406_0005267 [Pleurotus cornucopiae]